MIVSIIEGLWPSLCVSRETDCRARDNRRLAADIAGGLGCWDLRRCRRLGVDCVGLLALMEVLDLVLYLLGRVDRPARWREGLVGVWCSNDKAVGG